MEELKKNSYIIEELKYQSTGIVKECEQFLGGGYFSLDYIKEKTQAINAMITTIETFYK